MEDANSTDLQRFNVNAELLSMGHEEVGDYVIVHELLHFFAPNHGKLWKSLMRAHLGEYERVEERLRVRRHQTANQRVI